MNSQYYQAFREHEEKGLKKEASIAVRAFISSFENDEAVRAWVWSYLPTLEKNGRLRIRHEIFHELIYPILKSGYENNDFSSTLWLGKLAQNIYQANQLHEALGWVSQLELYRKSHDLAPSNDEARLLLLEATIDWLAYSEHEWPSGILYGNNGATLEQCDEINAEVQRVRLLDKERRYREFTEQYINKLNEYRARLGNQGSRYANLWQLWRDILRRAI